MITLLAAAIAYFLGAIPFGYLLVKWTTGRDVRTGGSGNIGATNVLRTTGRGAGIATLLLDIGKGYLAVWIAGRLSDQSVMAMCVGTLAVMAGHAYPVFLYFKGGKAVASFVGAFLCLTPLALSAVLVVFVVVVAWTRFISMASVVSAATFPLAVWLMQKDLTMLATSAIAGAFIIYKHSSNIQRLHDGTEHTFTFGARKS
jgi:glycerol-3-phosphate acyltransferase PlsY